MSAAREPALRSTPTAGVPGDPAGLLARFPALRPLRADFWVRRALASGDPLSVYRALFLARLTGRLRGHRRELRELLRTRRVFARPLDGKRLMLGTVNGIGAGFVGRSERQEDGTRIATHVLEFAGIPLFPLGAYIIRSEKPSRYGERWTIYGEVPLGPVAWCWSRGLSLAVLLLAARAWYDAMPSWP